MDSIFPSLIFARSCVFRSKRSNESGSLGLRKIMNSFSNSLRGVGKRKLEAPPFSVGTHSVRLFTERYLGGRVGFTSSEAEGTAFTVSLPLALS